MTGLQGPPEAAQRDANTLEVTLQDALRLGTAYSLALQASHAVEDSARYERDARWARFDWKLRIEGSLTDTENEGNSELSGAPILDQRDQRITLSLTRPTTAGPTFEVIYNSEETTTNNSFSYLPHSTTGTLTLGMTQSLLAGRGRDYVTANQFQADNDFAFQSESVRAVRRALVEQILQAYWSLVSAQGAMDSADRGVQYAEEFLKLAQDRYDAGVGLELDILQAQTELAVRTQTRTQLHIGRMNAEDALRQFLYTTNNPSAWSENLIATDELPQLASRPTLPGWKESYVKVRSINPEIRQQELKLSTANRLLHVAESDEQSRLDFQLRVSTAGFEKSAFEAWEEAVSAEYPTVTAAIRWDLPISGAEPRARSRKTRSDVRNAQLELDSAERKLTSNLRMVIRALDLQYFAFKSAESSHELATRQHKIELARYSEGRSTAMRVLAAQQVLLEAQAAMLEAQATFVIAKGQLEVLLGEHDR
ncbi:MAG: TolC family protein [Planctomycetes bacterium]|nr:TolC family protein [Planctomycetota bacterium]